MHVYCTTYDCNGYVFDRGIHYNWSQRLFDNDPNLEGRTWLFDHIENYNRNFKNGNLYLPTTNNGNNYYFTELNLEQKQIAFLVMDKIIEWVNFPKTNENKMIYDFMPLRMTVIGKAGSGKSFLIHTLITLVRQLTGINDSVIICGPTGKMIYSINMLY